MNSVVTTSALFLLPTRYDILSSLVVMYRYSFVVFDVVNRHYFNVISQFR